MGLTMDGRKRDISIGSRRGIGRPAGKIYFIVGRAIVCSRCESRSNAESQRSSRSQPGIAMADGPKLSGPEALHRQRTLRGFKNGKLVCCPSENVSLRSTALPICYSFCRRRRRTLSVGEVSRKKNYFIYREAWM